MAIERRCAGCNCCCTRTDTCCNPRSVDGCYGRNAGGPGDCAGYILRRRMTRIAVCPDSGKLSSLTYCHRLICGCHLDGIQSFAAASGKEQNHAAERKRSEITTIKHLSLPGISNLVSVSAIPSRKFLYSVAISSVFSDAYFARVDFIVATRLPKHCWRESRHLRNRSQL